MIGVIGDLHLKAELSYSDYVADRREPERQASIDTIVNSFKDCESVVFLGDSLNARNNTSQVISQFVELIKRLQSGNKKIYILVGNHEKFADGNSAIDFIEKFNDRGIRTILRTPFVEDKLVFMPYTYPSELGTNDAKKASKTFLNKLPPGDILFLHQAIAGTEIESGQLVDLFNEIVLNREELEKKYKLIFAGHIHKPQRLGNTVMAGSVFTQEVGEEEKYIWKVDEKTLEVEQIKLPVRPIYKIENSTVSKLNKLDKYAIVKAVFTEKQAGLDKVIEKLREFDAHIIVEQYPDERKKIHFEEGFLDMGVEKLLGVYAKERNVDSAALISAYSLIR